MLDRRLFLRAASAAAAACAVRIAPTPLWADAAVLPKSDDDLFRYIHCVHGCFEATTYKQLLGAANEFKEGDAIVGVAAADDACRRRARALLAATRLGDVDAHPLLDDELYRALQSGLQRAIQSQVSGLTFGKLKEFLLTRDEPAIKAIMPGLSSDVIGCVVKLMTDAELIAVAATIFNPLPGTRIGAQGYLGARIQPNSPTDNVDDIRWQVLDGWSYAVGDVVLGNNPVSSEPASVAAIERTLKELLDTFGIADVLPHCVLAHIDVQAEVERMDPGSTALWFQSIAGSVTANSTFDITLQKMLDYAAARTGPYGLYFETGQGADFTNGHGHGFDMVLHESRKYGFARLLSQKVAAARGGQSPWVHVNDVAGFIGPEVFRTREQLVRCCLEDIVMGKLHGLCIGLDVCSTLHMDISLDDLDWCLEKLVPAGPAYLMALPTKVDPMLGYLTTGFQDHVRLREKFGCRVNDRMWQFFQQLGVIDSRGRPTEHFGDPLWVHLQYRRRKGDARPVDAILEEGRAELDAVRSRGLFIASGHGMHGHDLEPQLDRDICRIYADAKECIWAEFDPKFLATIPSAAVLATRSRDRVDYILHPSSGEQPSDGAADAVRELRQKHAGRYDVQIVVSDGLNALAITDPGHLQPFLDRVRENLVRQGYRPAPEHLVLTAGRVRAGYRIGELLFAGLEGPRAMLHIIGERPGSGHHTFSVYLTAPPGEVWGTRNRVDHNLTRVIAGIATTALSPASAADETVKILGRMLNRT